MTSLLATITANPWAAFGFSVYSVIMWWIAWAHVESIVAAFRRR